MSQAHINSDEQAFVKLVDRFQLAIQLTKVCAKSCGLLNYSNQSSKLADKEFNCMKLCATNIQNTYPTFLKNMKTTLDIPAAEEDEGDDEDEE